MILGLNHTAFPEFAGDVASLLPDARVDTLAEWILELLRDPVRRACGAVEGPRREQADDWWLITGRHLDLMAPTAIR